MTQEERFWNNVIKKEDNECWDWTGYKDSRGYALFTYNGTRQYIHRISWQIHFGSIPDGLLICHHCDNPPCTKPECLFLGTVQDNAIDRNNKGRNFKNIGEKNGRSKLTKDKVDEIRYRYANENITQDQLGKEFGVDGGTVWAIVNNKMWVI
jgi:hypothetical protein